MSRRQRRCNNKDADKDTNQDENQDTFKLIRINTPILRISKTLCRILFFYEPGITPLRGTTEEPLLKYCKTNYRRIGRSEDPDREDEAVQLLLKIQPIHITRWLNMVAYGSTEPGPEVRPTHAVQTL